MTEDAKHDLEACVDEAVRALTLLDAQELEDQLALLGRRVEGQGVSAPCTRADRARLSGGLWVLEHLLRGTGQRLEMLRGIGPGRAGFGRYPGRVWREDAKVRVCRHRPSHDFIEN